MIKRLLTAVLAAAIVLTCAACGKKDNAAEPSAAQETELKAGTDDSAVMVTLGGESITENGYKYIYNSFREMTATSEAAKAQAEAMIEENLKITAAAKLLGAAPSEESVNSYVKSMIKNHAADYQANNVDERFIKTVQIEPGLAYNALLKMVDGEVTEKENKEYFDTRYIRAKHILVLKTTENAEEKIEEAYKRVTAGEDFDALIKEYGEDPGVSTAPNGYVFGDGEMVYEFEQAAKALKPGETGRAATSYGYHIIKRLALDETQEMYEADYENAADAIGERILRERVLALCDETLKNNGAQMIIDDMKLNAITD